MRRWRCRCCAAHRRAIDYSLPAESSDWRSRQSTRCALAASPSVSTWATRRSMRKCAPRSRRRAAHRRGAWRRGATRTSCDRRHPGDVRDVGGAGHRPRGPEGPGAGAERRTQRLAGRDWWRASGAATSSRAALMERKRIVNTTWRFFEQADFLLTPTTAAPAFAIDQPGPATIDGRRSRRRLGSRSRHWPTSPGCQRRRCRSASPRIVVRSACRSLDAIWTTAACWRWPLWWSISTRASAGPALRSDRRRALASTDIEICADRDNANDQELPPDDCRQDYYSTKSVGPGRGGRQAESQSRTPKQAGKTDSFVAPEGVARRARMPMST